MERIELYGDAEDDIIFNDADGNTYEESAALANTDEFCHRCRGKLAEYETVYIDEYDRIYCSACVIIVIGRQPITMRDEEE